MFIFGDFSVPLTGKINLLINLSKFDTYSLSMVFSSLSKSWSISPQTLCVRYVAPERRDESTLDIAAALVWKI